MAAEATETGFGRVVAGFPSKTRFTPVSRTDDMSDARDMSAE